MKLRVLIVNDLVDVFGGAEVASRHQMSLLKNDGHEVFYHGSTASFDLWSILKRWFNLYQYIQVSGLLKRFRPDVVHCHNVARMVSPSVALAAKRRGIPVVMTFHDYHYVCPRGWGITTGNATCDGPSFSCAMARCAVKFRGWLYPFNALAVLKGMFHRYILRRTVDFAIFANTGVATLVARAVGIPKEKAAIIPYCVAVPPTPPSMADMTAGINLLFLGRLSNEKGSMELLGALRRAMDDGLTRPIRLAIAGDGPLKEKLQAESERLKLSDHVRFLGKLNQDEVATWLAWSHIAVLPSQWLEVGPIAAQEAMAAGRPVVGPRRGGFTGIVGENAGWLYDPLSPDGLKEALISACSDLEDIVRRGGVAREIAVRDFSADQHYRLLSQVYASVLSVT